MPAAYLFDLDGTLYTEAGATAGAPELLRTLGRRGIPYRLLTNTSSRPRRLLLERLRSYGFDVDVTAIQTPMIAAAAILRERGHRRVAPFVPEETLEDLGEFELVDRSAAVGPTAVLVGDLGERWSYSLMQEAFSHLMDGAELIALSADRYWLREDGLALDAGPFVAGLEYATGKTATIAGKPSPDFFRTAVRALAITEPVDPREIVMVGDDLWSDVQGAQGAGYQGWLVRTGKFRDDRLLESGVLPDRILNTVADAV